ncbi:MAG: hypothetical protein QXY27_03860 [Nitrososphaerota archaeon]
MASSLADKEIIGDVDELFVNIKLPKPKKYRHKLGKGDAGGIQARKRTRLKSPDGLLGMEAVEH